MRTRTQTTPVYASGKLLLAGLLLAACSVESSPKASPAPGPSQASKEQEAAPVQDVMTAEELAAEEARLAAEAEAARMLQLEREAAKQRADEQREKRAKKLFSEVMEPLTEAAEAYSVHNTLDEDSWIGHDQEDNQEDINALLDDAISVLGVSEIATTRAQLRALQKQISELQLGLVADREARVSAPAEEDLNKLQKAYTDSREDLALRIQEAEESISNKQAEIADLERNFVTQMRAIGVELNLESARSLLSTVTGDDFIEMCVVFDNVRGVTVQLQELTEESGESLDAAKRYYGSYVVLIHLMDRIQLELDASPDDPLNAIINASQQRVRPILLTTATTVAVTMKGRSMAMDWHQRARQRLLHRRLPTSHARATIHPATSNVAAAPER